MYRNVTSRHLNLFGFLFTKLPGHSQLHDPCLGICSNAILHQVVMDLHSARCSGYFSERPIENGHPFLFPKIVPGLFPESKNSHLKLLHFFLTHFFWLFVASETTGSYKTPSSLRVETSLPPSSTAPTGGAVPPGGWRLSLAGKAGWTTRI